MDHNWGIWDQVMFLAGDCVCNTSSSGAARRQWKGPSSSLAFPRWMHSRLFVSRRSAVTTGQKLWVINQQRFTCSETCTPTQRLWGCCPVAVETALYRRPFIVTLTPTKSLCEGRTPFIAASGAKLPGETATDAFLSGFFSTCIGGVRERERPEWDQ